MHQQRAWPDKAHVTAQHVPQLGQLVETGRPKPAAEGGQPLAVGQRRSVGEHRVAHGSELQDLERTPVEPRSALAEKDGPPHIGED